MQETPLSLMQARSEARQEEENGEVLQLSVLKLVKLDTGGLCVEQRRRNQPKFSPNMLNDKVI